MSNPIYTLLGIISLILGFLGVILPLLPTTPFILLSAYLFSKGNPRLYKWLISLPRFGAIIKDWNESGTISKRTKFICFSTLLTVGIWLTFFTEKPNLIKVIVNITFIAVAIFVGTRPISKNKEIH